jgi:hypothetical protein
MLYFGTDSQVLACAGIIGGDLQTTRYATTSYVNPGQTIYNGPGLTNPATFPLAQYYGYIVPQIIPGPTVYAWVYIGTDGVVISSGYC